MNDRLRDARKSADRLRGRDRPGWGAALLAGIGGMVAGLIAAYLFDPTRGRTRRARLGGQAAGYARSVVSDVERSGRRAAATAEGAMRGVMARISSNEETKAQGAEPIAAAAPESEAATV